MIHVFKCSLGSMPFGCWAAGSIEVVCWKGVSLFLLSFPSVFVAVFILWFLCAEPTRVLDRFRIVSLRNPHAREVFRGPLGTLRPEFAHVPPKGLSAPHVFDAHHP